MPDSNFDDPESRDGNSHLETIVIINCVLNAPLILISITGNALVLATILKTSSLRSEPSFIFLCSLAIADLFVGFIAQPIYIASEVTSQSLSLVYDLSHITAFFACGVSLCTVAAISLDRFLALHYHMRYSTLVTITRVWYTLVIIWLIDILLASVYFVSWKVSYIIMAFGIATCVLISTFSYIRIYRIVRRHQRQILDLQLTRQTHFQIVDHQLTRQTCSPAQDDQFTTQSHSQIQDHQITRPSQLEIEDRQLTRQTHTPAQSRQFTRQSHSQTQDLQLTQQPLSEIQDHQITRKSHLEIHDRQLRGQSHSKHLNLIRLKKSAINTFVFYIFIILCYVPKSVLLIIFSGFSIKWEERDNIWNFANTLVFFNSSINPLLYCWRIRELRTAVLKLSRKIFLRPPVEDN